MGARYYAPWLTRWTACDPINTEWYNHQHGNPGRSTERQCVEFTASSYEYCYANPVRFIDPTGEQTTIPFTNIAAEFTPLPTQKPGPEQMFPVTTLMHQHALETFSKSPLLKNPKTHDKYESAIAHANHRMTFFRSTGRVFSAYVLARYMEGKGGIDIFSYKTIRSFGISPFAENNKKLRNSIISQVNKYASSLKNEGSYTFTASDYFDHAQGAAVLTDLGTASGSWEQLATGTFTINVDKKGNYTFQGTIKYTFADNYKWHTNRGGELVNHKTMNSLKDIGANEFAMRAYYAEDIIGNKHNFSSSGKHDSMSGGHPEPRLGSHYDFDKNNSMKIHHDFRNK